MKAFWAVLAGLMLAGVAYVAVAARASSARATAQAEQVAAREAETAAKQATQSAVAKETGQKQADAAAVSAADLEVLRKQQQELAAKLAESKRQAEQLDKLAKGAAAAETVKTEPRKTEGPRLEQPVPDPPKEAPKEKPKPTAEQPKTPPPTPDPTPEKKKEAEQPKPSTNGGFSISEGSIAPPGVTGSPTKPVVATVKAPMFAGFEVVPAKIEKKEDGSLLVDGKYVLKGEGTTEKPYVVPWDILTSVEETFDPQSAKKKLPERVTMLDGKVVKFSGYIAFPLVLKETKECLSMLNQWDGCCIGVPPTPYDAVEVSLVRTIKGEERFTTSGVVTGTFHVKPYLQGDWLIGLYVMDGVDLKSRDYGGTAGN